MNVDPMQTVRRSLITSLVIKGQRESLRFQMQSPCFAVALDTFSLRTENGSCLEVLNVAQVNAWMPR